MFSWSKVLSKPFTFTQVFIKIGLEIGKLQWFEYIQNDWHECCHILGFVMSYSPNKIYKNLIIMGFQEYFVTAFNMCLIMETSNHFRQSNPKLWEEQLLK